MGFYGNITNTSRTQFQFDKIYPSRRVMEENMQGDGVFVGRYVLVEYDSDVTNVYKNKVYRDDDEYRDSGMMFSSDNYEESARIRYIDSIDVGNIQDVDVAYGVYNGTIVFVEEPNLSTTYYQCNGSTADGQFAHFIALDTNSNYVFNYSQDKLWAEEKGYKDIGRGWDSTVWQKVYANGVERYVMIAELNSVVPTFDISADAPSISPVTPHFDANSTNVYYKLHWQPQWGVRIKSAYSDLTGPILNRDGTVDNGSIDLRAQYYDQINYPSDASTEWSKQEYDPNTDITKRYTFGIDENSHNGSWINLDGDPITQAEEDKINAGVPAAIYFNKDGLDSLNIVKSSDLFNNYKLEKFNYVSDLSVWPAKMKNTVKNSIKDDITLTPTGLSGHKYNAHSNTFDERTNIDTYEFSLMLPSLGDTISDIWDLIYGGRNIPSIQAINQRNKDITWEDAAQGEIKSGLRLVHLRNGQFSYNPQEVETLAGCINTAHDIMGMIIQEANNGIDISGSTPQSQTDLNNLSINNIVYTGGAYYRKRKFYDYKNERENNEVTVAQLNSRLYNFEQVDLIDFNANVRYYEKVIPNYLRLTEIPEEGKTIYTLASEPNKINYDPNAEDFNENKGSFSDTYFPNKYYYTVSVADPTNSGLELCNYVLETAPVQDNEKTYVALRHYDENGDYQQIFDNGNDVSQPLLHYYYFYKPDTYYFIPSEDTDAESGASTRPTPDSRTYTIEQFNAQLQKRTFYCLTKKWEYDINQGAWVSTDTYVKISSPSGNRRLVLFEHDKYFTFIENTNTFEVLTSIPNISDEIAYACYTLPYRSKEIYFYQAGLYYYKPEGKEDFILDTNSNYTPGRWYYQIPTFNILENVTFYESGKYYITDNDTAPTINNAVISNSATTTQGKFYWKKADIYVANDPQNIYAVGMKWDLTVQDATNAGIVLCNRTERWGVEELKGFTDKINTMLGLILRIRAILDEGNYDTRDTQTVQGCINLMNDIIAKFGDRKIGDVMITNNYGQIAGARQTTSQIYNYTNIGKPSASSNNSASQEDQWLDWSINTAFADPVITLKHKLVSEGHAANATDTKSNLNNTVAADNTGLNASATDTIDLYTPIVDTAGHVVGTNTETVTLPYGFKVVAIGAQSDAVTQLSTNTTSATADNTQDTLTLNTGNKWIRLAGAAGTSAAITIAHEIHTVSPIESTATLAGRTDASVSFAVPTYSFDEAGHYNGLNTKTYTLTIPYVFKTIKVSNDSATVADASSIINSNGHVANAVEDTLTFSASNRWIKFDNNTSNIIKIGHTVGTISTSATTPTLSSTSSGATFAVPTYTYDEAGHITAKATATYTVPNSYGKFTDGTNTSEANVTHDSFTISGDTWSISTVSNDTINLTHSDPHTTAAQNLSNINLAFGDNFTIEDWSFDNKGHKANRSTHTVTIPSLSLSNNNTSGNIVSNLVYSNGAFTATKTNLSNLTLDGFVANNAISGNVVADDTLSTALNKIQNKVGVSSNDNDLWVTISLEEPYDQIELSSGKVARGMTIAPAGTYIFMAAVDQVDDISNPVIYKYDIDDKTVVDSKNSEKKGYYRSLCDYSGNLYATGFGPSDNGNDYSQIYKYDFNNNSGTAINMPSWYQNFNLINYKYNPCFIGLIFSRHAYDIYAAVDIYNNSSNKYRPFTRSPIEYANSIERGSAIYTHSTTVAGSAIVCYYVLTILTDSRASNGLIYGDQEILVTNLAGETIKRIKLNLPYYEELEDICVHEDTVYFNTISGRIYKIDDISIYFNHCQENCKPLMYKQPCYLYICSNGTEQYLDCTYNNATGHLLNNFTLSTFAERSLLKTGARGMFKFRGKVDIPFTVDPYTDSDGHNNIIINLNYLDGLYTYEFKLTYQNRQSPLSHEEYMLSSIVGGYRDSSGTVTTFNGTDSATIQAACNNIFYDGYSYIHHIIADSTINYNYLDIELI